MTTDRPTLDFDDGRYSVRHMPGVAFWLKGWETTWREPSCDWRETDDGWELLIEGETYIDGLSESEADDVASTFMFDTEDMIEERTGMVLAVMVGDDREHVIDPADLEPIADEDYCSGCGQIGCGWS